MYSIGEFSKMAKVTVKTLRHYDSIGLLRPARTDGFNRYRYYTLEQLNTVSEIQRYRAAGLPLKDIERILGGEDRNTVLREHLEHLRSDMAGLETMMRTSEELIDMDSRYEPIVRNFPECYVYYRRGVIDSYSDMGRFVLETGAECSAANPGLKCCVPDLCYVSYLDGEYRESDISVEYAQAVQSMGNETENVKFRVEKPVKAVCVMHKGPYSGLGAAYSAALDFVRDRGLKTVGAMREQYIDGCWNKESEEDYLTEVQIPVE